MGTGPGWREEGDAMMRGSRRILVWGAALLAVLLMLAMATAYLLLRRSLPTLEGDAALPGLSAPARVDRDALGMVTITAANRDDAVRALGYVHAQERFFEMDLMRRTAAGELSALFGPAAVETDKRRRVHRMRQRIRDHLDSFTQDQRDAVEAYVAGVNSGLAALDTRPWPYLLVRQAPQPWTVEDVALTGFAMYFDLQDAGNTDELALWQARPHLPPPLWALVTHDGSQWDAPIMGSARGDAHLPGPDALDLRQLAYPATPLATAGSGDVPALGSNNFAVSGSMSTTGSALVADDMHLGLRVPNIWFRARLRYPDGEAPGGQVDATGFTLPGLPAIVVGSNGHVAWGFTNSYGDWLDWQEMPACGDDTPAADCPPVRHVTERIEVAGGEPVDLDIEETDWGPILHRGADGRRMALRWVAHQPGALTIGLMDFVRADSVPSALAIADRSAIPAQNLLLGDSAGQVAWRLLGPLPLRAADCRASPVAAGPPGMLDPPDACPPWGLGVSRGVSVVAPEGGRLWTANNRVADGELLARIGDGGYVLGARARQIRDGLRARNRFDEQALLDIQLDDRSLLMERWWTLLQAEARRGQAQPALEQIAAAAGEWSGHADVDSVAYRLVRGWRQHVHERIADGLTGPARAALGEDFIMPRLPQLEGVAWPLVEQQPAHLLPPRFDSWQALFEDAAVQLRDELAPLGPLSERRWGERNTARICHPLQRALPSFAGRWLCMPATPLPGDSHMPRVQSPDMGASERMVVSPGHEDRGIAHMPGGQSGHLLSPFWGAGHEDWVEGRPTPFLPGPTRYSMTLEPTR